jgi:hypothetical protein
MPPIWATHPVNMAFQNRRIVFGCLIGLAIALLVVGGVSGTVLRHVVQILPVVAAILILRTRPDWGAYASIPIFVFWIGIVALIWLFLLGISHIANGRFTPIEIVLTFFMMVFSLVGAVSSIRLGRSLPPIGRLLAISLFALFQVAAMWLSFLKPIANR